MRTSYLLSAAAYLILATAFPSPKQSDDKGDDQGPLDMSSFTDGVQRNITKPCTDPLVKDVDQDPEKIWEGLGCHYLRGGLDGGWSSASETSRLSYVEYMSNRIHGPQNWNCGDMDNEECNQGDVQCQDTFYSCGFLIMNSLAKIHHMHRVVFESVQTAHDRLQDVVPFSFTDTFAPDVKKDDTKFFADIVAAVVSLGTFGAGAIADTMVKGVMKATKNSFPQVKDGMMISSGLSTPLALNHIGEDLQGKDVDSQLADALGKIYDALKKQRREHLKELFSGSTDSALALYYMMDKGALIHTDEMNISEDIEKAIQKLFLGMLIPEAWWRAPTLKKGDNTAWSRVFFVNTNEECGSRPSDYKKYAGKKDFEEICFEDEAWYLMVACAFRDTRDPVDLNTKWTWSLEHVPGDSKLFDDKGYYGVTAEDLLVSAHGGWKKGNGAQYWKPPTDQNYLTGDGPATYELHNIKGIHEPGAVQVLICHKWDDAMRTISKRMKGVHLAEHNAPDFTDKWPCG